ncbi:uncharacterized protein LOC129803302 [Phlebotomus papatasi]|uniref:uncharacterized protein LOC129803302 n=1 Tax=Phlebotomus papatasi TaxID=29031 RepID=UPI002483EEFE|nr:uncharacterized protein LOC129803302 [Phlebotomus papatasi]
MIKWQKISQYIYGFFSERNSRASTVENILGGIIKEEGGRENTSHEGEMSGVVGESEGDNKEVDSESLIASSHKSSGRSEASHITGVLSKLMDLKRKSTSSVSDVSYFSALFPTTKPLGFGQARSCVVGSGQKKIHDELRETPKVGSSKTMADLRDVEQQQCSSSQKILQSFHDNEESVSKEPENINDLINDTTEKDCSTFVLREISSRNSTNCSELGEQVESVGEIFQLNDDKSNDVIDSIEETPKITDILDETIENIETDDGRKLEEISTSVSEEVSQIESCKTLINPEDDRVIEVIEDVPKITENLEKSIEDLVSDHATISRDSVITVRKDESKIADKIIPVENDIIPDEFFEAMKESIISQLPEESIFDEKISLIGTDRTEYTNAEEQPVTIHTLSSNPSKSDIMFTAREAFTPKSFQMDIQKDHQFNNLIKIPDNQAKSNRGQMKDEISDSSKEWFFGEKAKFNYDMFTRKKSNDQENDQGEIKNMTEEIISSVIECLSICPSGNDSEKVRKQLMQISSKNGTETCQSISDDEQLSTFTDILNIKRDLFEIQEKIPETSMMFEITRTLGCLIRDDKCKDFCGSKIRELTKVIRIFVNGWKKEIDPDLIDVEVSKTQVITIETKSERSESDDCQEVETKTIVTAASYQTINSTGLNSLWETVTEISQMDNISPGEIEQQSGCVSALEDNLKELANFIDQLNSKEQKQSGMRTVSSIMNLNKTYRSEANKKKPDDGAKKSPTLRRGNKLSNRSNKNICSYRSSGDDRSIVGMLESARSYINYFYDSLDNCSRNNFRVTYRNISSALESLRIMNESADLSPNPDVLRI